MPRVDDLRIDLQEPQSSSVSSMPEVQREFLAIGLDKLPGSTMVLAFSIYGLLREASFQ